VFSSAELRNRQNDTVASHSNCRHKQKTMLYRVLQRQVLGHCDLKGWWGFLHGNSAKCWRIFKILC